MPTPFAAPEVLAAKLPPSRQAAETVAFSAVNKDSGVPRLNGTTGG